MRRKFGNVPTRGKDSRREARRGAELRLLLKAGEITDLVEQPKWELIPAQYINGKCVERAVTYSADYSYRIKDQFEPIVEDCKGYPNDRWPIKRKLMLWVHGIRVREV